MAIYNIKAQLTKIIELVLEISLLFETPWTERTISGFTF
jgi:hypothetical protein